jgi:hypothetical protein
MNFEIVGGLRGVETIAVGPAIREVAKLRRLYGFARWKKKKGLALVRLDGGLTIAAELHWYEANGIGRKEFKIKRFLD